MNEKELMRVERVFNPPLKTIVSFLKEISLDCFTLLLRWSFQNISPGQGRRASFIGGAGDGWGGGGY